MTREVKFAVVYGVIGAALFMLGFFLLRQVGVELPTAITGVGAGLGAGLGARRAKQGSKEE